jgi:hypothetical protein
MKKHIAMAVLIAGISASATAVLAGMTPGSGLNGSWHDLNSDMNKARGYTGDSLQRTCVFCHTPHNARGGGLGGVNGTDLQTPLWNHADMATSTLIAYKWVAPLNAAVDTTSKVAKIPITDPLVGPTRLCMACHDGNTAVDAHGSAAGYDSGTGMPLTGVNGTKKMDATYTDALGATVQRYITDLQVTHPIGFLYDDAFSQRGVKELVPKGTGFILDDLTKVATTWNTNSRSIANYSSKKIEDTLYNGYMTCASCHEVHNTLNVAPLSATGTQYNYFLYAPEEGSAICLSCHVK